jgi:hypothetical protein
MTDLTTKRLDSVPDIFGIETLQVILARPYRTCANLCRTTGFPARKIGREWRISRVGLQRWIEREFRCE